MTESDGCMAIIWEERGNKRFEWAKNDIGHVNGGTGDRESKNKDWPSAEWIAKYLTMDGDVLF